VASEHAFAVTQANFEADVLEASFNTPVLIDFWAPWCAPCRQLMPTLERIVGEANGALKLAKVNTDEEAALAGAFGIRSLPTVVLMKNGQVVDGFMGAKPESAVREMLAKHLSEAPVALEPELEPEPEAEAEAEPVAPDLEQAAALLEAELAKAPDKEELKLDLADAYAKLGRVEAAETLLAALKTLAEGELAKRVRTRIEFTQLAHTAPSAVELEQAIARNSADLGARHLLGVRCLLSGQSGAAMDQFLHILKTDRTFGEDLGRKSMVSAFRIIEDADLVGEYRRKMTSLLF